MASPVPVVSIVIPTFNSRRWIGDAVDSALAQTYPHCEVLVVDDGSTDETGQWLSERYGSRIHYIWKQNGGISSARNLGLKHATGRYIQFLDSDDLLHPQKVATHVAYLDSHPEVAVVYSDCLRFRDDRPGETYEWGRRHLFRSGQVFESMLGQGYLLIHMALCVRDWLDKAGPFDESLKSAEDFDYWLRLSWAGATFQFLDGDPLVLYRVHSDSMSQRRAEHGREILRVVQKIRSYVVDPLQQRRLRLDRVEGDALFIYGRGLAEEGRLAQGLWHMARGIRADRRDLNYKLAFMLLAMVAGPARADAMVERFKTVKAVVVGRLANSRDRG